MADNLKEFTVGKAMELLVSVINFKRIRITGTVGSDQKIDLTITKE